MRGFTLAEMMIAILFISIALFGYAALHIRIMHSGEKIEVRSNMREQAGGQMIGKIAGGPAPDMSPVPNGPPTIRTCKVRVDWKDRNGDQKYEVDTYVREPLPSW